jgi:hypothetical protein
MRVPRPKGEAAVARSKPDEPAPILLAGSNATVLSRTSGRSTSITTSPPQQHGLMYWSGLDTRTGFTNEISYGNASPKSNQGTS